MNSIIIVSWRRIVCGLWRVPAGDIYRAYSASHLPRVKTFHLNGRLFTCMGISGRAFQHEASAHELIPADSYTGPESVKYSHEGALVTWQKQSFRLGPRIQLRSDDPIVDEWRGLLRVLYADGGMFAARKTYAQLLSEWAAADYATTNQREAIRHELASPALPETQQAMTELLQSPGSSKPVHQTDQLQFNL